MNGLILPCRQVFIVDTHVNLNPTAEQLAELTQLGNLMREIHLFVQARSNPMNQNRY